MESNCTCSTPAVALSNTEIRTIDAKHLSNLRQSINQVALLTVPEDKRSSYIHVLDGGDVLVTESQVLDNSGDIVLVGTIGPFPYEVHIKVELEGTKVTVTLEFKKPFAAGPFKWEFELGGALTFGANGEITGATTITPSLDIQPFGINWWCAAKCGGLQILPTLVLCLPALAGGPAAYVACVVAKVGAADAANIAKCVAEKCV